jgi:hypothetical protein
MERLYTKEKFRPAFITFCYTYVILVTIFSFLAAKIEIIASYKFHF